MSSGWGGTARRTASVLLVAGLTLWIVRAVASEATRTDWAALDPEPLPLLAAALLLVPTYLFRASLWNALLRSTGESIACVDGWRLFMGAQLGRYLPGKLWQIAGAGLLARSYGVSAGAAAIATLVGVLIHHLVGGVLALLALRRVAEDFSALGVVVVIAAAAGLVAVTSPLLPRSLAWLARVTGRPELAATPPPPARTVLLVTPGYAAVWLVFAGVLCLVARGLFPSAPPLPFVDAVGVMSAAAVAGFVVLIAPSGLGVREAVIVALLGPTLGALVAGVVAVALRVVMTAVELSLSLWGAWPWLRRERAGDAGGAPDGGA
jgi:hypothetical protein